MGDLDRNLSTGQVPLREQIRYYARKLQRHPRYLATSRAWRIVRKLPIETWRAATHQQRDLPAAIIVGAQKAGTTQLYEALIHHSACFRAAKKELNYFSHPTLWPIWWYRSQFPRSATVRRVNGICIEASPAYLPSPLALQRMREALPNAKIIAILRDPVARAFSNYQHSKSRHRETRAFSDAVHEIMKSPSLPPQLGAALKAGEDSMLDYVNRGYYALQIETLWLHYPREQTLILDCADLFDDTNAVCQKVFDFLGLQRQDVVMKKVFNRGYYREAIDPEIAEELRQHYQPYDQLLAELTGQSFRWIESSRQAGPIRRDRPISDRAA